MALSPSKLRTQPYRTLWIASTWACLALVGCDDHRASRSDDKAERATAPTLAASSLARLPATARPPTSTPRTRASSSPSVSVSAAPVAPPASSAGGAAGPELELGSSAPVALGNGMMVAKNKKDSLIVSRLQDGQFQPITTPPDEISFWPVALASGASTNAYWVSGGRLVRREVKTDGSQGPLQVLASDAANRGSVSASRSSGAVERDVVMYIGSKVSAEGERSARLWVEGHGSRPISREAGGATSLSVVPLGGGRFALVTLDGRVGMSPVHAVSLELDAQGAPHLGEDRVVHVAGPAERGTALTGVRLGRGPMVLLPISKDAKSFGLLMLRVGYGDGETPSSWVDYPNGMDPAPLVASKVCGKPTVAFVRPQAAAPNSPQVLELGRLDNQGELRDRRIVASATRVRHIDLRGEPTGGWLVYATEQGLRGQRVDCK